MSKANIQAKLHELIDAIEEEYGDVEGFEVRLEHKPITDGERQAFASVKEFILVRLQRTKIDFK